MSHPVSNRPLIEVVVAAGCEVCGYSRELVALVGRLRPDANIVIADRREVSGETIIATPTYRLDGRTVSLGNPELSEFLKWIDERASTDG